MIDFFERQRKENKLNDLCTGHLDLHLTTINYVVLGPQGPWSVTFQNMIKYFIKK